MGKGDIKSKRGKIFAGSFGKVRSAKTKSKAIKKALAKGDARKAK